MSREAKVENTRPRGKKDGVELPNQSVIALPCLLPSTQWHSLAELVLVAARRGAITPDGPSEKA